MKIILGIAVGFLIHFLWTIFKDLYKDPTVPSRTAIERIREEADSNNNSELEREEQ